MALQKPLGGRANRHHCCVGRHLSIPPTDPQTGNENRKAGPEIDHRLQRKPPARGFSARGEPCEQRQHDSQCQCRCGKVQKVI